MKLQLKRFYIGETCVIGRLSINGIYFCDTLEDIPREVKIQNETCIPAGTYKVIINLSNRFKTMMPLLLDVPNFTGIRIHSGNTSKDTSGCILVGINTGQEKIINSRITFKKLMERLTKTNRSEPIFIEIE